MASAAGASAAARDRAPRIDAVHARARRRRGGGCGGGPAGTRQTCRDSSTAAILKAVVPHCPHLQELHEPSQSAGCERRARRAGGLHLTRVEPSRPRPSAPAAQPLCISVYARSAILPAIVHSAPSALTSAAERGRLGSGRVRTAKAFLSFRPRNTAPIFVAASSCVMPWFHVSVVWPSSWAASICAAVIVVGGSLCADSQNSPSMGSGSPSSQVFCTGRGWVMARGWPVGGGRAGERAAAAGAGTERQRVGAG